MVRFPEIFRALKKWLVVPLLFIMAWQQWITFSSHEKKFLNPIHFVKENYGNDYITQYGIRYEGVKKIFTKPVRLSYIGESNEDFNVGVMHYYLSQYYLTPNIILRNDIVCDTILYNLYSSIHFNPETNFHLNNGWHIIKDFNNGLIVLAK
jgi:hypothetical protein